MPETAVKLKQHKNGMTYLMNG